MVNRLENGFEKAMQPICRKLMNLWFVNSYKKVRHLMPLKFAMQKLPGT